jgi:hypothetical protein
MSPAPRELKRHRVAEITRGARYRDAQPVEL